MKIVLNRLLLFHHVNLKKCIKILFRKERQLAGVVITARLLKMDYGNQMVITIWKLNKIVWILNDSHLNLRSNQNLDNCFKFCLVFKWLKQDGSQKVLAIWKPDELSGFHIMAWRPTTVNIRYSDYSCYWMVHLSLNRTLITGQPFDIWAICPDIKWS
jgi:hypothetical protein